MIHCPSCEAELVRVLLEAPAVVVTVARVQAELVPSDLREANVARDRGARVVKSFRLHEVAESIDPQLDWRELEVDCTDNNGRRDAIAYCLGCDAELPVEVVEAWLEQAEQVPA